MTELSTEIIINASPEQVWKVLTDFGKYPEWNPFIKSLTGTVAENHKITAILQPPGSKGMTFKPRVLVFRENEEFRWLGHLMFRGVFDGEHCFRLIRTKENNTRFIQSEKFRGILVPFMKKMLEGGTKQGFIAMNEKLKERVEKNS